jgi:hypothetical protein
MPKQKDPRDMPLFASLMEAEDAADRGLIIDAPSKEVT